MSEDLNISQVGEVNQNIQQPIQQPIAINEDLNRSVNDIQLGVNQSQNQINSNRRKSISYTSRKNRFSNLLGENVELGEQDLVEEPANANDVMRQQSRNAQARRAQINQGFMPEVVIPTEFEVFSAKRTSLINDWKVMSFASELMEDVRNKLLKVDTDMNIEVPRNEVKFDDFYDRNYQNLIELIDSCNTYIEKRKFPWSARGRRRLGMVLQIRDIFIEQQKRLAANKDAIRKSVLNNEGSVDMRWSDIVFKAYSAAEKANIDNIQTVPLNSVNRQKLACSNLAERLDAKGLYQETYPLSTKDGEVRLVVKPLGEGWSNINEAMQANEGLTYSNEAMKKLQTMKVIDFIMGISPELRKDNMSVKVEEKNGVKVITDVIATGEIPINEKPVDMRVDRFKSDFMAFDVGMLEKVSMLLETGVHNVFNSSISQFQVFSALQRIRILNEDLMNSPNTVACKSDDHFRLAALKYKKKAATDKDIEARKERLRKNNIKVEESKPKIFGYVDADHIYEKKKDVVKPERVEIDINKIANKIEANKEGFEAIKKSVLEFKEAVGKLVDEKSGIKLPVRLLKMRDDYTKLLSIFAEKGNDNEAMDIGATMLYRAKLAMLDIDGFAKEDGINKTSIEALKSQMTAMQDCISARIIKDTDLSGELKVEKKDIPKVDRDFEDGIEEDAKGKFLDTVNKKYFDTDNTVHKIDMKDMPLFSNAIQKPEDIKQGGLGDCYLLSSMSSVLTKQPDYFKKHMKDNGDGTVTVKLYDNEGTPKFVTVEKNITVVKRTEKTLKDEKANLDTAYTVYGARSENAFWVSIYEKAYAVSGFNVKNEGQQDNTKQKRLMSQVQSGRSSEAMMHILGEKYETMSVDIITGTENVNYSDLFTDAFNIDKAARARGLDPRVNLTVNQQKLATFMNKKITDEIKRRSKTRTDRNGNSTYNDIVTIEDIRDIVADFKKWNGGNDYKEFIRTEGYNKNRASQGVIDDAIKAVSKSVMIRNEQIASVVKHDKERYKNRVVFDHKAKDLSEDIREDKHHYAPRVENLFEKMKEKLDAGGYITLSSRRFHQGKDVYGGDPDNGGIVEGHSYILSKARKDENTGHLILKIRNPWAMAGFKYEKDSNYDDKATLIPKFSDEDSDGYFELDMNDFIKYFDFFTVKKEAPQNPIGANPQVKQEQKQNNNNSNQNNEDDNNDE